MKSEIELKTVAGIIDGLSHYQVLKVSPVASIDEIREAFHREALDFHPDQYTKPEQKEAAKLAKKIYARVVKAYQTLSQPSGRTNYDQKRGGSQEQDFLDENEITGVQGKDASKVKFPGKKFFDLAQKALLSKNLNAAKMNIQIAIGAEPDNRQYKELQKRINSMSKS